MTDFQKQKILAMRKNGCKYTAIAAELKLSENTVKSFCRRNISVSVQTIKSAENGNCQFCGLPLVQTPHKKQKKFCSDKCRNSWWNAHPEAVKRKAVYKFSCVLCGAAFESYGDADRKYCSRACFGLSRRARV